MLVISKWASRFAVARFRNHSHDCSLNCTPLGVCQLTLNECFKENGMGMIRLCVSTLSSLKKFRLCQKICTLQIEVSFFQSFIH